MKPLDTDQLKPSDGLYAVIRVDSFQSEDEGRFTVKEIVLSEDDAVLEVERLNRLNASKGCTYFWQYTRLRRR